MIGVDALRYTLVALPGRLAADPRRRGDHPAGQRQPGLLRAVRPRPARRRSCATRADLGLTPPRRRVRPGAARATRRRATCCARWPSSRASSPAAAELREPHRVARYLEDTAVDVPPVLRHLPRAAAWATRSRQPIHTRARLLLVDATRTVLANGLRPARRLRPGADVSAPRATRPAGRTADGASRGPAVAARRPTTSTSWSRRCGRSTARKNDDGALEVGGVDLRDLVAEHGSPAYVLDEADFRARARAFRDGVRRLRRLLRRQGVPVHDGRALGRGGGPEPRRLLGRGADGRAAGRLRPRADRLPRQQQDHRRAAPRASTAGVGRIVVDSFHEIERLAAVTQELGATARVMVRVTAGVEAHTHEYIATAHEDQKFGFSITSGRRAGRRTPGAGRAGAGAARAALAHRLADLRHLRVRGRRPAGAVAARPGVRRARRDDARARPRRRLRHRLHHPGRPVRPRAAGHRADQDRRARVPAARRRGARALDRAGPRDRRTGGVHASTRSAPSRRSASTPARAAPTSPSTAG